MPDEILKNLLNAFNVKSEEDLMNSKADGKQTRSLVTGSPKLVELTVDQCKKLCEKAGFAYKDGYENRVLNYVTTNETVDRYGDIVRAKGLDFKTNYYPNNPVMMYMHDYKLHPIGNTIKIWYEASSKSIPVWGLFIDPSVDLTWISELAFRLSSSGFMRACSIGFMPIETKRPKDEAEREKLGLGKWGVEYVKGEYLEWSPCGIPANPQALNNFIKENQKSISFDMLDKEIIDKMAEVKLVDMNVIDIFSEHAKGKAETTSQIEVPDMEIDNCDDCEINTEILDFEEEEDFDEAKFNDFFQLESSEEIEIKPYPNEHACRLNSPDKYDKFRRGTRKHGEKTYSIIFGRVKESEKWEQQAFRYAKKEWKVDEAKEHCKSHNGKFEAAASKDVEAKETVPVVVNVNLDTSKLEDLTSEIKKFVQCVEKFTVIVDKLRIPDSQKAEASEEDDEEDYTEEDLQIDELDVDLNK